MKVSEFEELILVNANSGDSPHPYLVFDGKNGVVTIAEDYETTNDPTMRDFVISKADAVKLAREPLVYARGGTGIRAQMGPATNVET